MSCVDRNDVDRCANGGARRSYAVAVRLYRDELLYDVKNEAYSLADAGLGDDVTGRMRVQDVGEPGAVDIVTRGLGLAYAELQDALFAYAKVGLGTGTLLTRLGERGVGDGVADDAVVVGDDRLAEPGEYVVRLVVPEGVAVQSVDLVKELAHRFMVVRGLWSYLSLVWPAGAERYGAEGSALLERMQTALNSRVGRVRRTLRPW